MFVWFTFRKLLSHFIIPVLPRQLHQTGRKLTITETSIFWIHKLKRKSNRECAYLYVCTCWFQPYWHSSHRSWHMPSTPKPHTSTLPLRLRWYRTLSSSILWGRACPISPGVDTWPGRRRVRIEGCVVINAACLGCCQGGGKGCRAGPDGWGLKHKLIRHGPWICSTSTLTLITDRIPEMGLCICLNRQMHTHKHIHIHWLAV